VLRAENRILLALPKAFTGRMAAGVDLLQGYLIGRPSLSA
jgi:hypothetical protein